MILLLLEKVGVEDSAPSLSGFGDVCFETEVWPVEDSTVGTGSDANGEVIGVMVEIDGAANLENRVAVLGLSLNCLSEGILSPVSLLASCRSPDVELDSISMLGLFLASNLS